MPDNQPSTPASVERTATGEIKNQGQTTAPAVTTPQTSTTTEPATTTPASTTTETKDDASLVNQGQGASLANQAPPATGAPEAYEAFNVPDGYSLDEETIKEASAIFKKHNLSQAQAQEYVDLYTASTREALNAPYEAWRETQKQWVSEVKADPFLGPRLSQVQNTIAKAIDHIGQRNPNLATNFRQAMDFTGAGNNPAFIRMLYEMASMLTEGQHVQGRGPSPAGQQRIATMPSAAQAMYPNLPSGT